MREHDVTQAREGLGFVPLEPQDLRRGKAGKHQVAYLGDHRVGAAGGSGQEIAFFHGGGVVPEFDVIEGLSVRVERHEAVLVS